MTRENLLIQELLTEAKRDLEASNLLLKTNLIEIAAWHTEQAFEKSIMYVYASYKIKFQRRPVDSVHDKMEEKLHTDKHMLMVNMLTEMISDFRTLGIERMNSVISQLPSDQSADLSGFLQKIKPAQNASKATEQLRMIRSTLDSNAVKSMPLEKFLDLCTAANFKKDISKLNVGSAVQEGLVSLTRDGTFEFASKDVESAVKAAGLDQPELYIGLYRFPSLALIMARRILTDPISTRYPLRRRDHANLKLYRERVPGLHDFYLEVNQQIKSLIQDGEEFLRTFQLFSIR